MLFSVWSLIDFMILCRGGEREEFIVLEYIVLMSLSAYSGVDRDRAGAYAYFWMIPVKELTKLIYSKSIQTHTPSAGLWSQFPTRLYRSMQWLTCLSFLSPHLHAGKDQARPNHD